jgi:hypothetical protein
MPPLKKKSVKPLTNRVLCGILLLSCLGIISCTVPFFLKTNAINSIVATDYSKPTDPLEPIECGKCHNKIFNLIKNNGGKHRIDCRRCHEQFHQYIPEKNNYQESLPKCSQCHNKPHGEKLIQCANCHQQVHTPLDIPASNTLSLGCDTCHSAIDKEIKMFITQHSNFYCSICHHTKHGYKPECMECHMPHSEEMMQADCLTCHLPHQALQVVYPSEIPNQTCALCHKTAYNTLIESNTKHAGFRCTKCHPDKHRTIKQCQECHIKPHDESITKNTQICGSCHGIAHSLVI